MTFANSWSSNIPAVETKGGTGNAAYVVGDMLYSDATNNLARRAIGTTGQLLTVVAGVPNWASAAAAGGSLTLLNSTTATAATSVTWGNTIITNAFSVFLIVWDSYDASATQFLTLRLSTDNGATFLTTSYSWGSNALLGSTGVLTDKSGDASGVQQTAISLGADQSSSGTLHTGGAAFLFTPTEATIITSVAGFRNVHHGSLDYGGNYFGGSHNTAAAHNAVRLLPNTGTITGNFHIYGLST